MATDTSTFNEISLDQVAQRPATGGTGTTLLRGINGPEVWNFEDYNLDFQQQQGVFKCEMMRRSDPVVQAGLYGLKLPIKSAKWAIVPGKSVKQKNRWVPSDLDKQIAEAATRDFIDRQYGGGAIQPIRTWSDLLSHILTNIDFGFSAFAVWWSVNEEGRHVPEFSPRMPWSVYKFELDPVTRGLAGLWQRTWNTETAIWGDFFLPASELAIWSWNQEGDNYWGIPVLRAAYKPWDLKRRLEIIDSIRHEKHGVGVDEVHALEDLSADEKLQQQQVAQNVRAHERLGITTSYKMKYELHTPSGSGTDINGSIARLNTEMLMAMLQEAKMMGGPGGAGNRALGEVKQDDMRVGLQGIVDNTEDGFDQQILRKWTIINFGPQKSYPMLESEPLDKMGGGVLADIVSKFKLAQMLTPGARTEEWVRGIIRAPEEDEPYPEPLPPMVTTGGDPNQPNQPPKPKNAPDPASKFSAAAAAQPSPFWRAPMPHENYVAFSDIQAVLDGAPKQIWQRSVVGIRTEQIRRLAQAAASARDSALAKGQLPHPLVKQLADAVNTALLDVYQTGRMSVIQDAARQYRGEPGLTAPTKFAAQPVQGANQEEDDLLQEYPVDPTADEKSWIRRLAESFALTSTLGLVSEAVRSSLAARQANASMPEIEFQTRTALEALSEPVVQADLSGKVTQAFTNGRIDQGKSMASDVVSVFYTSLLDGNTCDPCAAMDGAELDPADYDTQVPNPNCDGGDRCRCEPVFVFKDQDAEAAA